MLSDAPNQEQNVDEQAVQTLAQKISVLQERLKMMGFVHDGSDDKAFMDDAWTDIENKGDKTLRL